MDKINKNKNRHYACVYPDESPHTNLLYFFFLHPNIYIQEKQRVNATRTVSVATLGGGMSSDQGGMWNAYELCHALTENLELR